MRLFRDAIPADWQANSVVTIGNFDGLHLGHQALVNRCREVAGSDGTVAVVTFEPLPRAWFDPSSAPPRLYGVRGKLDLLARAGVDLVWMMRFNGALASMSPESFARDILFEGLGARHVVLGDDFRFGHRREGDLDALREYGRSMGFSAEALGAVTVDGDRASSTAIRSALAHGDLATAQRLLGRPYSMSGHVVRGRQLGRELGYPTANIRPPLGTSALSEVYAVRARWAGSDWRHGVANMGARPVVDDHDPLLEVHVMDFEGDLYGRRMECRFVEKIRDIEDFENLDALTVRMKDDEQAARTLLAAHRRETVD